MFRGKPRTESRKRQRTKHPRLKQSTQHKLGCRAPTLPPEETLKEPGPFGVVRVLPQSTDETSQMIRSDFPRAFGPSILPFRPWNTPFEEPRQLPPTFIPKVSSTEYGHSGAVFGQSNENSHFGAVFRQSNENSHSGEVFGSSNQNSYSGPVFGQSNEKSRSGAVFGLSNENTHSRAVFGSSNEKNHSGAVFGTSTTSNVNEHSGSMFAPSTTVNVAHALGVPELANVYRPPVESFLWNMFAREPRRQETNHCTNVSVAGAGLSGMICGAPTTNYLSLGGALPISTDVYRPQVTSFPWNICTRATLPVDHLLHASSNGEGQSGIVHGPSAFFSTSDFSGEVPFPGFTGFGGTQDTSSVEHSSPGENPSATLVQREKLGPQPMLIMCQFCLKRVVSTTVQHASHAWTLNGFSQGTGVHGWQLRAFCDTEHHCPNCKHLIGTHRFRDEIRHICQRQPLG